MATLFDKQIDLTYQGLIKTTDNSSLGAVEKAITDGIGTLSTLKLGNASASFTGTLDLTGATVTGLPPGGVSSIIAGSGISVDSSTGDVTVTNTGADTTYDLAATANGANVDITLTGSDATVDTVVLVAGTNVTLSEAAGAVTIDVTGGAGLIDGGTGTGSMKNAASLVTTAPITKGDNDFVIGDNASVINTAATDTRPYNGGAVVIGQNATQAKSTDYSFVTAYYGGVSIGFGALGIIDSSASTPISIGRFATSITGGIAIGGTSATIAAPSNTQRTYASNQCVAIGTTAQSTGGGSTVALGHNAKAISYMGTALGSGAQANNGSFYTSGTAIGSAAIANTESGIAIGNNSKISSTTHVGAIVIGTGTTTGAAGVIAIGTGSSATAINAVALGTGVVATRTNCVTGIEFECSLAGGGMIFTSPNGTKWRESISDTGVPVYTLA
jgi:hypothetical protein